MRPLGHDLDPIATPPAMEGETAAFGATIKTRAWRIDKEALAANLPAMGLPPNPNDATLCWWLIEAPWAHPFWHSYTLSGVHLRPVPGGHSPAFFLPGATHELALYALNPDFKNREGVITGQDRARYLVPVNYVGQVIEASDDSFVQRVEAAVRMICDGKLSPDTDFRRQWFALFGDHYYRLSRTEGRA